VNTWSGGAVAGKEENTLGAGAHWHTVTIGGGDTETAPVHYGLNTYLKVN
jgi:hypothetical protein